MIINQHDGKSEAVREAKVILHNHHAEEEVMRTEPTDDCHDMEITALEDAIQDFEREIDWERREGQRRPGLFGGKLRASQARVDAMEMLTRILRTRASNLRRRQQRSLELVDRTEVLAKLEENEDRMVQRLYDLLVRLQEEKQERHDADDTAQ